MVVKSHVKSVKWRHFSSVNNPTEKCNNNSRIDKTIHLKIEKEIYRNKRLTEDDGDIHQPLLTTHPICGGKKPVITFPN